jgi:hypothetical protein
LRGVDPWVPVTGCVALLVYLLHGVQGKLARDVAVYAYGGQQVLEGEPPYVGIFNRGGPVAHLGPAVGAALARLAGIDDLLGMRLLYLGLGAVSVAVAYLVGREALGSRAAGLATAAALLSFEPYTNFVAYGPREKALLVLFVLAAMWATTGRHWFLAGTFVALATLTLQIAFAGTMAWVLVALVLTAGAGRARASLRVVAGGAAPVIVLLGYYAVEGAVGTLLDGFLLANAHYNASTPFQDYLGVNWATLRAGYGASLAVFLTGLAALVVLAVHGALNRRGDRTTAFLVAGAAGIAAGMLLPLRDYDSFGDSFPLIPFAAFGVGAAVAELRERLTPQAGVMLVAAWVGLATAMGLLHSVGSRNTQLEQQRAATRAVLSRLPADATMLSLEAPQPLVLARRTNPTEHQMLSGGMPRYIDDDWPGGWQGFRASVLAQDAEVVVVGDLQRKAGRWIPLLSSEYTVVGRAPEMTWLVRTDLGEELIRSVRSALRRAR